MLDRAAAATETARTATISCNIRGYARDLSFVSTSNLNLPNSNFDTCKDYCSRDPEAVSFAFTSRQCHCLKADVSNSRKPDKRSINKERAEMFDGFKVCSCVLGPSMTTTRTVTAKTSFVRIFRTSTTTGWTTQRVPTTTTSIKTVPTTITVTAMRRDTKTVTETQRRTAMIADLVTVTVTKINTVTLSMVQSLSTVRFNTVFLTDVDTAVVTDEGTTIITDAVTARTTVTSTSVVVSLFTTTETGPEVTVGGGTTTVWGS
ncbi:hypothetical protein F52700_8361 [Fusarium sp. NRRL 52700]|nr:hypothetical protein F52700_8361 [Fusarium sp. NRRL 52700]